MRHQKKGRSIGRKTGPRKALLRGLATDFVIHGKIKTTEAKAKELRPVVEKNITTSKTDTLHTSRQLLKYFYAENRVNKLIKELGPKYKSRSGGYTRIIKVGTRNGDQAKMAILELV